MLHFQWGKTMELLEPCMHFLNPLPAEGYQTLTTLIDAETILAWCLHIDKLVQERRNSSALSMELHLSCTNPSICSEQYYRQTSNIIAP